MFLSLLSLQSSWTQQGIIEWLMMMLWSWNVSNLLNNLPLLWYKYMALKLKFWNIRLDTSVTRKSLKEHVTLIVDLFCAHKIHNFLDDQYKIIKVLTFTFLKSISLNTITYLNRVWLNTSTCLHRPPPTTTWSHLTPPPTSTYLNRVAHARKTTAYVCVFCKPRLLM